MDDVHYDVRADVMTIVYSAFDIREFLRLIVNHFILLPGSGTGRPLGFILLFQDDLGHVIDSVA